MKTLSNWINAITNVIGVILVLIVPIKNYLDTQPFEWTTFIVCVLGAIIAYFTGKSKVWENK